MNNPEHHTFLYNKRYNTSVGEIIEKHNTLFKIKLLHFLSKNRFTAKRLHVFDKYSIQKTKGRFAFDRKIKMSNDNSEAYRNITLSKIDYFEALEIDDFDKYINKIVSTFSNDDRMFSSTTDKDDMKEKLSEVKKNLDTISWGKLFYINFDKRREKNNDLLATVDVSYIKTNESFFIIRIQVSPSEKFKEIFAKIINSEDVTLSKQHYHTYYNILKLKRFHAHETMSSSSKCLNIENLLSDLNQQVKGKITKHFVGYFHNSKIDTILPSLEYYEVEDFTKFHNDNSLKDNFNTGFDGYYSIVDNQIEVYFSKNRKGSPKVQVIKQKGHGKKPQSGNDHTDYDWVETYFLLNSLAFPCVFRAILLELFDKLNSLKRNIYDFSNDTKKINFFKSFFFIKYNNSYLKLKQTIVQILITTKRFENEFTKNNLALYTREYNLEDFTVRNYRRKGEKKNLLQDIVEDFSFQILSLKNKTKDINEIFKSIEELNSYRTNYFIQIISLFIAVLAFIFTFSRTKEFFIMIFKSIFN